MRRASPSPFAACENTTNAGDGKCAEPYSAPSILRYLFDVCLLILARKLWCVNMRRDIHNRSLNSTHFDRRQNYRAQLLSGSPNCFRTIRTHNFPLSLSSIRVHSFALMFVCVCSCIVSNCDSKSHACSKCSHEFCALLINPTYSICFGGDICRPTNRAELHCLRAGGYRRLASPML